MIREIIEDAERACALKSEGNKLELGKMGIKLPVPKFSGSDSLEHFLRFTKEAAKWLSLYDVLKEEHRHSQTDIQ